MPLAVVVVFQEIECLAAEAGASSLNWTPAPLMLSLALVETVIVPDTVGPAAGEVSETVGGIVSDDTDADPDARHPM